MNELISLYGLTERKGEPVVSSRKVADIFGKEHKNVLRDIECLDCSQVFSRLNFELSSYKIRGKKYAEFLISKDGFAFLVMGYRGKKAAKFKEDYITAFNMMREFIQSLSSAKLDHPAFTHAIMDAHTEPKHYHCSNEADMINKMVLGVNAKKYREINGIEKGKSIRPYLTPEQIKEVERLQRIDIGLIYVLPDFYERKNKLKEIHELKMIT